MGYRPTYRVAHAQAGDGLHARGGSANTLLPPDERRLPPPAQRLAAFHLHPCICSLSKSTCGLGFASVAPRLHRRKSNHAVHLPAKDPAGMRGCSARDVTARVYPRQRPALRVMDNGGVSMLASERGRLERFGGHLTRAGDRPRAAGSFPRAGARSGAGNRRPGAIDAACGWDGQRGL